MIRKWILASVASAVMAVGMVGCGEDTPAPVKKPVPDTKTPAVTTGTPKVDTSKGPTTTETKTTETKTVEKKTTE